MNKSALQLRRCGERRLKSDRAQIFTTTILSFLRKPHFWRFSLWLSAASARQHRHSEPRDPSGRGGGAFTTSWNWTSYFDLMSAFQEEQSWTNQEDYGTATDISGSKRTQSLVVILLRGWWCFLWWFSLTAVCTEEEVPDVLFINVC